MHMGNSSLNTRKNELEKRLKVMMAGVMLFSVDGLRTNWWPWVHDENKRIMVRNFALDLILNDDKEIETIINKNYKENLIW
jgi:hypothetical protein